MDNFPNPPADAELAPEPNWARLLPRDAFAEIILVLRGALPPPGLDDPDAMTPRDWARRDRAAMAAVAALQPENAAEGRLAARFQEAWKVTAFAQPGPPQGCNRQSIEQGAPLQIS